MVLEKLFLISLLALSLFASEDELKINRTQSSDNYNKTLNISNRILKEIITKYLTIIDASHLYRTNREFYELYGGNDFGEWLKENQQMLKFFYKPLNLEEEIDLPSCNFILKFPPEDLVSDETDEKIVFKFEIVGSINPYETKYLKPMPIKRKRNLNDDLLSTEDFKMPKLKRRTNSRTSVIMIVMNDKGHFRYQFRNDALSCPKTGLLFYFSREYPKKIGIYDGTRNIYFGYVKLERFIVEFHHNFPQIFPKQIHVYIPHSNYLKN